MITLPTEGEFADVGISLSHETSVVPLTVGIKQKQEGEVSLDHRIQYCSCIHTCAWGTVRNFPLICMWEYGEATFKV